MVIQEILQNIRLLLLKTYIMEEKVIIHEIYHKKMPGVLIKLYFEKAYDKVNWAFL
jgi:hypothetical protein